MFTVKRKKNYRSFLYAAIIVTLCLIIVVIAWPAPASDNPEDKEGLTVNAQSGKNEDNQSDIEYSKDPLEDLGTEDDTGTASEDTEDSDESNHIDGITEDVSSYYLVKNEGGTVKVFFVGADDNPVELETTQILYELLGPEDQQLFDEGITVGSQEELAVLLQDFES